MTMKPVLCMIACTAFYGFPAAAATVFPYAGDVFVSTGSGFHKINGAAPVRVGDSVMVSPGGLAQVQLDDGNLITVSPGEVLSVPRKARPKDAALPDGAHATQAGGGQDGGSSLVNNLAIGAAAAVGLGAALAAELGGGHGNNPVSP
jgi:hypothetical protein